MAAAHACTSGTSRYGTRGLLADILRAQNLKKMMRRCSAFLTCVLVLTLSLSSGIDVCASMMAHAVATPAGETGHHHDSSTPAPHSADDSAPADSCLQASSCAVSVDTPAIKRQSAVAIAHPRVVFAAQLAPASQLPDLEPPPPKA